MAHRNELQKAEIDAEREFAELDDKRRHETLIREEPLRAEQRKRKSAEGAVQALLREREKHEKALKDADLDHQNAVQLASRQGFDSGLQLGREIERYGENWTNLSPAQRAERKQRAQRREAQVRGLEKTNNDFEGRMAAGEDHHRAALNERFEAGRRQGLEEAEQSPQNADENRRRDAASRLAGADVPAPRWMIESANEADDLWSAHASEIS